MNVRSKNTDKKQRVLDATLELIAEKGLHNTPMSEVSNRSGISAGAIYHYFESKEVLINHLYLELKKEIIEVALTWYNIQDPYKKRFYTIWRSYYDFLVSNPMKLSFIEQCSFSPLITEETIEKCDKLYEPAREILITGIESGYLKKMDPDFIASLIHGSIVSTAKLKLSGYLDITEEHMEIATNFCWGGLKAE